MAQGSVAAGGTILVVMTSSLGVVYVARLAGSPSDILNKPGQMLRIAVGGSVVTLVLLITAEASPPFARAMAWLVLFGVMFGYGGSVARTASNIITRSLGGIPRDAQYMGGDPNKIKAATIAGTQAQKDSGDYSWSRPH